ncbi:MAG: hypothetical protein E2O76_17870 [Caldithrix sp.]|nr:MAG: hypothetical protein E2O76_17870 [Caldithrix sp.]
MVCTDYLSLLKFDSGWKIVAKVYHKHTKLKPIAYSSDGFESSDESSVANS